ncbi:NHL repeat-containing protein [Pseudomonas sp. X10]
MVQILRKRGVRWVLKASTALVVGALGFFSWQSFYPVQAATGWDYQVLHRSVAKAASLLPLADGSLLVSRELNDGKGSILKITAQGDRVVLVDGLSKPDGMVAAQGGWVFSQEGGKAPVSLLRDGQITALFEGENVQGLWNDGDHLYAIEDRKGNGRLMRYGWDDGRLEVLRSGLTETEGLTRCSDGRLLYTEKASGQIRALSADGQDPVVIDGLRNPTFLLCDQRGLWISEDSTHRARLLRVDAEGRQHTVLSFLKAPQAIVPDGKGGYLLAEGGRDRVLHLAPLADDRVTAQAVVPARKPGA